MNPLKKIALSFVGSLKVLHSIRGRLRINVGGIKSYPEYAEKYAPMFLKRPQKEGRNYGSFALQNHGKSACILQSERDVGGRRNGVDSRRVERYA